MNAAREAGLQASVKLESACERANHLVRGDEDSASRPVTFPFEHAGGCLRPTGHQHSLAGLE